ncbi:MAG: excinuclease ABC subunit UvrC [Candidatus Buchananbacteria bacterium]|nr:excinuclease ABC subunit UvrC [Candidatus Buchananbacteria bacterium]
MVYNKNMTFNYKKHKIPHKPGVYLYKNKASQVIYVGKAKDLHKRIAQYFKADLDYKTKLLVAKIADVEFITTTNEVEALLLEQNLIHQYDPKYNISLRGDIRYAYIKITDEKFPRLITARKITKDGRYYGPYTDAAARRLILNTLRNIFKLRNCNKMPKKVCLQYHIDKCSGPCEDLITEERYIANVKNAERLLKGKTKQIIKDLNQRMQKSSANQQYELAKIYRDQKKAIQLIEEKQKIDVPKKYDQDVINWLVLNSQIYFQIFNIDQGVITSRHKFNFKYYPGIVEDFIKHYYSINFIPRELVLPEKLSEQNLIQSYLQKTKNQKFGFKILPKVDITVPLKGDKYKLLQLVKNNLETNLGLEPGLVGLKEILNLEKIPKIIEFFDASTLQGKYNAGAMIQMDNGRFNKNQYRKFKIKWLQAQDDVAMIYEIVLRRYYRLKKENKKMPNLIVIDGGRGQLNSAIKALQELKLDIAICSLAKREEEIYLPNKNQPLNLDNKLFSMKILTRGRDEVHRFVIKYHRELRKLK